MTIVLRVLECALLAVLIVLLIFLGQWAYREAPLIHNAFWNFSEASSKVNAAAGAAIEHSTNELQETQKATAAVKTFFDHTDLSVNGRRHDGLIPQATALMVSLNKGAVDLDGAIQNFNALILSGTATAEELRDSLKHTNDLIDALRAQATDPSIKFSLDKLAESLQNAADATKHVSAMAADGQQMMDKARETYLKPVNLWWAVVRQLIGIGGSVAQMAKP